MGEQNSGQNIEREIDTNTFIVFGKMRNGKSLTAICMGLDYYPRIYSNVNIYQNGVSIVNFIESYEQIEKIRFSNTPGILIIDEAGINANSKDSRSAGNRTLQETLFLIGKKNLSLIWIAQRFESIDVNARVLADAILEVKKMKRYDNYPIFNVTKQKQKGAKLEYMHGYELDCISIMRSLKITYNQLEESKLAKTKDLKETKSTKNIVGIEKREKFRKFKKM